MDERIAEALSALSIICAAAYRNGTQATVIEPQKALIKRLLTAVDRDLAEQENMSLNQYQTAAKRTLGTMAMQETLINACLGLAGESGEVCDMVKKMRFQGHPLELSDLVLELGDVLWYVAAAASALGVQLDTVGKRNIEKIMKRYPDGFDPERSRHRDEHLEGAGFET